MLHLNCIYNPLPEDEPSVSKHVEDIKELKLKILILKIAFFGLYFIIV
jgi:hypothetical protein